MSNEKMPNLQRIDHSSSLLWR